MFATPTTDMYAVLHQHAPSTHTPCVSALRGARILAAADCVCRRQSLLTEYMQEFAWPSELPVPGRRGKRSGMGMDHVGRLLAGRRAEDLRRYDAD